MTTEAEWITPELLGRDLSDLLGRMRYADRKRGNYYIKYTDLRPTMTNESQDGSLDDYRVRLLFLFRFWNAMEYFNPNRNLTDKPWDKVLGEYIPLFLRSDIKYSSIMRLYAELCDTHGAQFSWSLFGGQTVPASVTFVGDRVFVIRDGVLRKGDEILSVDGRQWSETYDMLKQYEPVSNDVMRGLQTARALLLTTKSTVRVEIIRDGRKQTLLIDTQLSSSWHRQSEEDMIEQCEVKVYDGAGRLYDGAALYAGRSSRADGAVSRYPGVDRGYALLSAGIYGFRLYRSVFYPLACKSCDLVRIRDLFAGLFLFESG